MQPPAADLSVADRTRVVAGLQVAVFLSAIDQTLVSVALLSIARELGGASLMAWVMAGYTVAATVVTPLYGGLSDLYGRRRMMTIAIATYIVACTGCAFAGSMGQLIALRALQGLGSGGLLVLSQSTIGDVVPAAERGRYQAWLSGTYALAALLGPVAGGYLTEWFGWRTVFLAGLPIALLALVLTRRILGRLPRPAPGPRPDYRSVAVLALGLTGPLVALTRIGQGASLADPAGLGLLIAGLAMLALFLRRQYAVPGPIIAPQVMDNRVVRWACLAGGLVFFALIGGAVMLPLALQAIAGMTPDRVARMMILHALSVPVGAFCSGRMMLYGLRFRRNMVAGALLGAAAAGALAFVPFAPGWPLAAAMSALGVGIGLALPPGIVAVQTAVAANRIGAATAFMALARSIGSAVGLAVLTSVLFAALGAVGGGGGAAAILRARDALSPATIAAGFDRVFACMATALVLSALAATRLPASAPVRGPAGH